MHVKCLAHSKARQICDGVLENEQYLPKKRMFQLVRPLCHVKETHSPFKTLGSKR